MKNNAIAFGFTGDLCPSTTKNFSSYEVNQVIKTFRTLNDSVDFSVTNFESVISPDGNNSKGISSSKANCEFLKKCGFNLYCLANNHILDEGPKALMETKNWLNFSGFSTTGVNPTIESNKHYDTFNVNKKRIAFINTTDATHYRAKKNTPGVIPLKKKIIIKTIKKIKKCVDLIIIAIHSDMEFKKYPSPWRVNLSRTLIKHGANIVIHHHPHVNQGIEKYKGGIIAYSLGNFLFPVYGNKYMENQNGNTNRSAYLKINVIFDNKISIDYEILPMVINKNNIPNIANKEESKIIFSDIKNRSHLLNNKRLLRKIYWKSCKNNFKILIFGAYYEYKKNGIKNAKNYITAHLTTDMHKRWIVGFFTMGHL